jgi:hypothetical protein
MAFGHDQSGTQAEQRIVAASSHLDGERGVGRYGGVIADRQVCERSSGCRERQQIGPGTRPRPIDGARRLGDRLFEIALAHRESGPQDGDSNRQLIVGAGRVDPAQAVGSGIEPAPPELTTCER